MADVTTRMPTRATHLADLRPLEVASQLRHLPGMVFFDSAGHLPLAADHTVSVIAARPERLLRGSIHLADDRAVLTKVLADGHGAQGDTGFMTRAALYALESDFEHMFGRNLSHGTKTLQRVLAHPCGDLAELRIGQA